MLARAVTVTLRPVEPADENLLRSLFAEARPELALLPPQTRDVLLDMQFRAQQRQYAANYVNARHEIIVADGSDVGQLIVDDAATEVRIIDVTVRHSHRSGGIGSTILRDVITDAGSSGRPVELSVWSGNTGAQRLYTRLGFVRVHDAALDDTGYLQMRRNATKQEDNR
jgi:ribosomal protein S18 acetylase RimI-like enzyme